MITLKRTDSDDTDFIALVRLLDDELAVVDGEEHTFYSQFNKIGSIKYVVVAYSDGIPAGCGAIKDFSTGVMEIKRMFVLNEARKKGIASGVLNELEKWAAELGSVKCILETGKRQTGAVSLYKKNNYRQVPNYGQYAGIENSICFEKTLMHN
jgi:GNAT superfamily N-acetyltransferase